MSKAKKEQHSPRTVGAHFASVQRDIGGQLMTTLKACIQAYTVENKAEYTEMVEGYGEQVAGLYDKNTAKVRKSEFKKIVDHASTQETRQDLFNIIDNYESVQKLASDLRKLEKGTAKVNDEGKVEKVKTDSESAESDGESQDSAVTIEVGMSQPAMIEALELIMQAAYDQGFMKAADLIQQAMTSLGRGEK
jgi:hypothetical protein